MAEEVIKECEFYLPLSEKCNEILDSNGNEIYKCSSRQDCYYKQLKRLEQENKELLEKFDEAQDDIESLTNATNYYFKENEELKNIINVKAFEINNYKVFIRVIKSSIIFYSKKSFIKSKVIIQ